MYDSKELLNIKNFLIKNKFNKGSYDLYNEILIGRRYLTEYILFLIICQAAFQIGFIGYFNELFDDVNRRKVEYYRQILSNFKSAYLYKENICYTIYYKIRCKKSRLEINFHRLYGELHLNDYIWQIFENIDYKENFIKICNELMMQKAYNVRMDQVVPFC